jgi:hypothetical protein
VGGRLGSGVPSTHRRRDQARNRLPDSGTWPVHHLGRRRQRTRPVRPVRPAHPDVTAGTVTVTLDEAGGHSQVTVTYQLTALSEPGKAYLDQFTADYPAFLQGWQDAIMSRLG